MDKYDLLHEDDLWKLRKEGAQRAIKTFETKDEGMGYGQDFMRKHGGSLRIRRQDDVIQEERTYPRAADPKRTPG